MAPSHRRTRQSSSSASASDSDSDSEPYSPDEEEQVDIPGHIAQSRDQNTIPSAPMTSVQRESSEDELYTSWFRVAETTETDFPAESKTGPAPFVDLDGSPIFIGSALMERSVHPCKIGPRLEPSCVSVPYNGTELNHHGRYDLLPYSEQEMEWVPTSHGRIPKGRRPVLGGHDENSNRLYHAAAYIDDIKVPGLTAEHLGGANFSFNRQEYTISKNYDLL